MTRRSFVKAGAVGFAALGAGGLLSACGGAAETDLSEANQFDGPGGTLSDGRQVVVTMTPGSEPAAGFDPLVSWGCGEHVHEPLIQSTLITTDENLEFKGDLATAYECTPDGMEWTFTLREGVKFTDGQPLTAHDVAFTVNGVINGEASEADLSMVKEAAADDDLTVRLTMNRPNNALLYTLAVLGIVPEHAYGEGYGAAPVGSGRYKLVQWDQGQQVILEANPDYYGEAPLMDRVVVLFMEEDASMAAAQAGQVDIAYTSATLAANVPGGFELFNCKSVDSRGISLPSIPAGGTKADGPNEYPAGNNATASLALRQAMNCGVDRQRMIDHVLNGYGTVAYSVGDGMPWASPDMAVQTDAARARQLLEEGGWKAGKDGVLEHEGVRAEFNLYYAAGDSTRQALVSDFAAQMAEFGIKVNVKGASWDDIYPHEYSDPVLWGWGSNAPVEMFELLHSRGWGNYACFEDPEIDANLEAAQAQANVEDSYAYYQRAQWDEKTQTGVAPQGASTWVWLANVDHLYFKRAGLQVAKQKPHPHGHGWSLVNNVDRWSWE